MKHLVILLLALCSVLQAAPIWQADFQKKGELDWKKVRKNAADRFVTGNGILEATCSNLGKRVNTGAIYEKQLPAVDRGSLFFEVYPNAANSSASNYNNLSLLIRFHGRLVSLRPGWWTYFFPKKGHRRLASIPSGKWLSFKIDFDKKAKTISYYCTDMNTPVFVEQNVDFSKPLKFQFGNYGLTNGTVINKIRNVRLEPLQIAKKQARKGVLILRGIDFDVYDLEGIAKTFGIQEKPLYSDTVVTTGLLIKNNFSLAKRPAFSRVRPKLIIMADFPFNGTLENHEITELINEVKDGANLIILGGMFTLNKGEFRHKGFNAILPVKLGGPMDLRYRKDTFSVQGRHGSVAIYQKCKPVPGAKILLKAENAPLLCSVKYGKGTVCVYTGIPGGRTGNKGEMIHLQKSFPQILKQALEK